MRCGFASLRACYRSNKDTSDEATYPRAWSNTLVEFTEERNCPLQPLAKVSDEAQAKILREVRIAAGRLGRLTLWGADMWIKDQYVDIFCRWVYLPLYAILAAISLNEST